MRVHILLRDESSSKAIDFMCRAYGYETCVTTIESVQSYNREDMYIVAETSRYAPDFADFRRLRETLRVDQENIIVLGAWNSIEIEARNHGVVNFIMLPEMAVTIVQVLRKRAQLDVHDRSDDHQVGTSSVA